MKLTFGKKMAVIVIVTIFLSLIPFIYVGKKATNIASDALRQQAFRNLEGLHNSKKGRMEREFVRAEEIFELFEKTIETLKAESLGKLMAMRQLKAQMLRDYVGEIQADIETFAESLTAKSLYEDIYNYHVKMEIRENESYIVNTREYEEIWKSVESNISPYIRKMGIDEVYMICTAHGHIMYSYKKESDLGENLSTGKFRDSSLALLWKKMQREKKTLFQDTALYESAGNKPVCFIATPIIKNGKMVAMTVMRICQDEINGLMSHRAGLGKTGETYLVGQDYLMRSDSINDMEFHSVINSLKNPDKGAVKTLGVKEALAGRKGADLIDGYRGKHIVAAWTFVDFPGGTRWALMAAQDMREALVPHIEGEERDFLSEFAYQRKYDDLLIFDPEGLCFFSYQGGDEYNENFLTGKYRNTNLGKMVKQIHNTHEFVFTDLEPYLLRKNLPTGFIGMPIMGKDINGKVDVELVVARPILPSMMNKIMADRTGMGKTGDSYLVGADFRMRSDSMLDKANRSVDASYKGNIENNGAQTEVVKIALAGTSGQKITKDYLGNSVLSNYSPIKLFGKNWACIVEMDETEAFEAVTRLNSSVYSTGIVVFIIVLLISIIIIGIARGMTALLTNLVGDLSACADGLASASGQIADSSQKLASGAAEQAASFEETSTSMEEMSIQTKQNADNSMTAADAIVGINNMAEQSSKNSQDASGLAEETRKAAEDGGRAIHEISLSMREIKEGSEKISEIIEVINDITHQTKLLATNAAIEAARAGDQGKGFAVVADEVSRLAENSKDAAKQIASLVRQSQKSADSGNDLATRGEETIRNIISKVNNVTDMINNISVAVAKQGTSTQELSALVQNIRVASEEQARGVNEVTRAIAEMNEVTQGNAASSEEASTAAEELSSQADVLNRLVDTIADEVGVRNNNQIQNIQKVHYSGKGNSRNKGFDEQDNFSGF